MLVRIAEDEAENKVAADLDDDDRGGWAIAYADRVLAERAAKRAIIEPFDLEAPFNDPYVGHPLLQVLSTVYSDHPDYRQERPPS